MQVAVIDRADQRDELGRDREPIVAVGSMTR